MGGIGKSIGGFVGGIFGKGGKSQRNSADQLQREAYDAIKDVKLPAIADLRIDPAEIEFYKQTGKLTPKLEKAIAQDPSLMGKIEANPEYIQAQLGALRKLQQVGREGLTIEDRARMRESTRAMDRSDKSRKASVAQTFADRGLGGSNAEMMAQLQAGASDTEAAANEGFNIGAESNRRALDAVLKSGDLGSKLRGQDFDEAAAKAKAQDEISRFNTQNQRDIEMRNRAQELGADEFNLRETQRLSEANADMRNKLTKYNKDLVREDYDRNMDKANSLAGAAGKYSAYQTGRAKEEDQAAVNKGQSIGGAIGTGVGLVGSIFSDKRLKKNTKPRSASFDKLLANIKGYEFEYKDESMGEGKRVGVMAQDLEKSELGKKMVQDTPEGKAIDVANAVGTMMASQGRLHERLAKLEKKKKD